MVIPILIGGFIAAGVLDMMLRKKYTIEKNEKFMDQYLNKAHLVLEVLACAVFMSAISINGYTGVTLYVLLFLFCAVIFVFRGAAEFIFMRPKRKHLISFTYTTICLLCSACIFLFM